MSDDKQFTTIDEYISTFPVDTQVILEKMRQAIQKAAPDAVETIRDIAIVFSPAMGIQVSKMFYHRAIL
jgi:uncharacterized protein YdhG (YjbR/CyaY superfamily)